MNNDDQAANMTYTVRYSNTSRNSVHGINIRTTTMSGRDIIRIASEECARQGVSLEDLAGIQMIEDADGNFSPEREMSAAERLQVAVEKLGDDGRMFEIEAELDGRTGFRA